MKTARIPLGQSESGKNLSLKYQQLLKANKSIDETT